MNLLSAIDNRCYFDNDSLLESENLTKAKFRLKKPNFRSFQMSIESIISRKSL